MVVVEEAKLENASTVDDNMNHDNVQHMDKNVVNVRIKFIGQFAASLKQSTKLLLTTEATWLWMATTYLYLDHKANEV